MKNNGINNIGSVVAIVGIVASSVFSYLWSTTGVAVLGGVALLLSAVSVCGVAKVIADVDRREHDQSIEIDLNHYEMNKAA